MQMVTQQFDHGPSILHLDPVGRPIHGDADLGTTDVLRRDLRGHRRRLARSHGGDRQRASGTLQERTPRPPVRDRSVFVHHVVSAGSDGPCVEAHRALNSDGRCCTYFTNRRRCTSPA